MEKEFKLKITVLKLFRNWPYFKTSLEERKKDYLFSQHSNEYYGLTLYSIYEYKQTISSLCPKEKCAG
jgi:hypothetical protein